MFRIDEERDALCAISLIVATMGIQNRCSSVPSYLCANSGGYLSTKAAKVTVVTSGATLFFTIAESFRPSLPVIILSSPYYFPASFVVVDLQTHFPVRSMYP
jgi:hypothetical protein